jgi:hypothetical protein
MESISVNLDGIPTEIIRRKIPIKNLKLDIENPRIQYFLDTSLNKEITQEHIKYALAESNDSYDKLKENIEANKGIFDAIWVIPDGDYYIVIEGNTRAFIYEELSSKYVNDKNWKNIDAYILPHKIDTQSINFIRLEKHLFGQTPWSAYEKARELYRLYEKEAYSYKRLQILTRFGSSEIKNNIQAYKDMEEQYLPKYSGPGERLKFSYFVEFRKNKELKSLVDKGLLSLEEFCDWVGEGKFKRGEDIRRLSLVLRDDQSKNELIKDDFQAALDQLEQKNPAAKSKLFEDINAVIVGLNGIPFSELDEIKSGLQQGKVNALKHLHETLDKFLTNIGAIK